MPTNNYLPFGVAPGANAWSDATYNGSSQQQTGIQTGIVPSGLMTKAWRQSSVPASAAAQIIVDHGLIDAVDDGSVIGFKANYRMALTAMLAGTAFAVDQSATANVLTIILDPAPPSLAVSRGIEVRIANTNTGPVTLTLNNLGSRGVVKKNGAPLVAGDLVQGQWTRFIFDAVAGQWVCSGAVQSDSVAQAQAAKAPFNVQKQTNTVRTSASSSTPGQNVTVLSGLTYTKKSATSIVLAWLTFQTYTPGAGAAGAITARFSIGTAFSDVGLNNGYIPTGSSQPIQLANSPIVSISGIVAGSQAISLAFRRDDAASWTTILNPTGADVSGYPSPNTLTLIIAEVEPS